MKPREFVEEYCIKSLVACFSGGKDSLVMTHYLHSELADTFVEETSRDYGWNLTVVEGHFFEKAEKILKSF